MSFSENREKYGDALNKQLTSSFYQFQKVSDDTDSQKERDESALADLRKAEAETAEQTKV